MTFSLIWIFIAETKL